MKVRKAAQTVLCGMLTLAVGVSTVPTGALAGTADAKNAKLTKPAKVRIASVKARGSVVGVKVKKAKRAKGYQYKLSASKYFKKTGKFKVKVKTGTKRNCEFKRLKAGIRYYVKVRAFGTNGARRLWGKWSKPASVKLAGGKYGSSPNNSDDWEDWEDWGDEDETTGSTDSADRADDSQEPEQETGSVSGNASDSTQDGQEKGDWQKAAEEQAAKEQAAKEQASKEQAAKEEAEKAKAAKIATVEQYSYEVQPLIAPFNNLVYVKTDNPDPTSFRLQDKSSKFITSGGEDETSNKAPGVFKLYDKKTYTDVAYEDKATFRVNGGYIFYDYDVDSDGGELVVQANVGDSTFEDTAVLVSCQALTTSTQYLIDTYTTDSMSFFEKMDAVQKGLDGIALYPKSFLDTSKPSADRPYPMITVSPHKDVILNRRYDAMFEEAEERLLCYSAYPFVLDSASFPSKMKAIAKKLNPDCTVKWDDYYHYLIQVTADGQTKYYGGAGKGGTNPFYTKYFGVNYTFDGAQGDLGTSAATLNDLKAKYNEYNRLSQEDMAIYVGQLTGKAFANKIGPGSWVKVGAEGWFGFGDSLAYIAAGPEAGMTETAVDAWVDGRYVSAYAQWNKGAKLSDHPTANIIVRGKTYIDRKGKQHTGDILYEYNKKTERWEAPNYYAGSNGHPANMELPDEFVLTKEQVESMGVDANTDIEPQHGLIYNGTAEPGTAF